VKKFAFFILAAVLLMSLAAPIVAQDMPGPSVEVSDQLQLDAIVDVDAVYSEGQGFVVIHNSDGPGIGQAPVAAGWTYNLRIRIDSTMATSTMSAMLHVDDGELGVYEFGTVEGADAPVLVGDAPVNPSFEFTNMHVHDQFIENNQYMATSVTMPVDGWLVIHSGDAETFGGVLGQTAVPAGTSTNVMVELAEENRTEVLWPMLHVDDGTAGTYEFDGSSGFDNPVVVNGQVASTPIWTVPHVRVADQAVMHGDGMEMSGTPVVEIASVLSDGPGFLVIHQEADGSFGGVAGFVAVPDGLSHGPTGVRVELDPAMVTPRLWPMLHVDDGAVGTYEFDGSSGLDNPVAVNGEVVAFPINASPAMVFADQPLGEGGTITVRNAIIDAPGWLVIHAADGAVLGQELLHPGANWNVTIAVDPALAGEMVQPMLHYDTGEIGVYEFGSVEGADLPTSVAGNIVVAPLNITAE
jgi:hypothetical protein